LITGRNRGRADAVLMKASRHDLIESYPRTNHRHRQPNPGRQMTAMAQYERSKYRRHDRRHERGDWYQPKDSLLNILRHRAANNQKNKTKKSHAKALRRKRFEFDLANNSRFSEQEATEETEDNKAFVAPLSPFPPVQFLSFYSLP